mgnify:CR=1 FL=1
MLACALTEMPFLLVNLLEIAITAGATHRAFVYLRPEQFGPERTPAGTGGPRFAVKGVKFWMDGSPYAGGAAFSEPYRNTPLTLERIGLERDHRGEPNYSVEEFVDLVAPSPRVDLLLPPLRRTTEVNEQKMLIATLLDLEVATRQRDLNNTEHGNEILVADEVLHEYGEAL